jgi:arylsulfatase A-like enzyme
VFPSSHSAAPVTPTSFASLFSGHYPTRVFRGWKFEPTTSLADYFSDAGYQTAAFVNNVQLAPERGFDLGFEAYHWRRNDPDPRVLDEALRWLENRDRRRPLFFWLHLLRPHAPYIAREEAEHLYRERDHGRFESTTGGKFQSAKPHEIRRIEDLYYGEVWEADRLFGRFERGLRRLGLWTDSIIVLTADHGEEFREHGGFQHGRLYEEHLRVPLILYAPPAQPHVRENVRARAIDLLPTLLDLAGIEADEGLDGESLLQARDDEGEPAPVIAVSMTGYPEETSLSLLQGDHKLILNCLPNRRVELYDLQRDPGERRDVHVGELAATRRLLATLRESIGRRPCRAAEEAQRGYSATRSLDDESVEALRSLGYLD